MKNALTHIGALLIGIALVIPFSASALGTIVPIQQGGIGNVGGNVSSNGVATGAFLYGGGSGATALSIFFPCSNGFSIIFESDLPTCGTGSGSGFSTTSADYYLSTKSTSNLTEGTNLYYTLTRWATAFAGTTTDALKEGSTNLYFTNARADARFVADLAATTSVKSITTLPSLSLPYSQLTGTPAIASSTLLGDNNTFSGNDTFNNTITGSVSGNAGTATALQNPRTINGVSFNGTANITVASTTLLGDTNIFSASTTFQKLVNLQNASSTLHTIGTLWLPNVAAYSLLATNANNQTVGTTTIGDTFLPLTGVSAGSYTCASLTVSAQGLLSAASTNSCGGTLGYVAYGGTAPSPNFGTSTVASTTVLWAKEGIQASSTSQFAYANIWSLLSLPATTSSVLATDSNGGVIATSSIGANLITGALGTINGTTLSRGGTITVSAASSSLLGDNNIFSATNIFQASTTIGNLTMVNSTTTNATTTSLYIKGITSRLLYADNNGQVLGSTTIGTNLLSSNTFGITTPNSTLSLGATSAVLGGSISADLNLNNSNQWSASTTFTKVVNLANASSTLETDGTLWLPPLGTAAGTFLAVDPNGKVIATSTPAGGGSGTVSSGNANQVARYAANGTTVSGSTLLTDTLTNFGVASTTPWALLSVASPTFNYMEPLFAIATTTDASGQIFGVTSTSSTATADWISYAKNIFDSGARVIIGAISQYDYPGILDQLFVNGRINTGDWRYTDCFGVQGAFNNSGTSQAQICPGFGFNRDTTGQWGLDVTNGLFEYIIHDNAGLASPIAPTNNGAGIFVDLAGVVSTQTPFILATTTPDIEVVERIDTPQNATSTEYNIGFTNLNPSSSTYEAEPTAGCFFQASSTAADWWAVCRTSVPGTMIDTGIASSSSVTATGDFYRFRIETDKTHAVFYIGTPTSAFHVVANISANYPGTTGLSVGTWDSNTTAGLAKLFDVNDFKLWFYQPVLRY
jgi:hypothetical protein